MKKVFYICLLFLLCSYNCLYGAYHNSFDSNGFRWELKADKVEGSQPNWPTNPSVVFKYISGTTSQTIIFFNMSITDYSYINPTGSLVTDIVIPSHVNWDSNGSLGVGRGPLQIIASNAFYNKPVTSVDIPSSILTIKLPCFNNCGNLKSIKIDGKDNFTPSFSSQSNYSTLNGVLFNNDMTQLKKYPEGKNDKLFKVPKSVSKLDNGCFANTKNLAVQFFGAVPEIHEKAFVNSTAVVYYPKGAEGWPDFDGGYFDEWGVMAYPIGEQDYVTEDGVILRFHKENSSVIIDNVMYGLGSCTIPSTIGGYPVTSIGDDAFFHCSDLTSVTIPDSVTHIGDYAFWRCSGLTKFIVDLNNLNYKSINGLLLTKDGKTLIAGVNGNVVIPQGVTSIGNSAFFHCSGLTSITIPDSVTSIGSRAFEGCNDFLYDTTTIQGVKLVDGWVVGYTASCPSVLDLTGIRGIAGGAFQNCSGLTSITIPDSVTSIDDYAFSGCRGLTSITIPGSVTSIDDYAFYGCRGLTSITIPGSVTSIGGGAFGGCWGLTSITIPGSVTSIGGGAFQNCSGLTSITIPGSVTSIGGGAFQNCSGLTSITIGNSVTSIENYAFYGCSALTSVTIPNSVTGIGDGAFGWCDNIKTVTVGQYICSNGLDIFSSHQSITNVVILDGVTSIGDDAFYYCDGLISVTIPDSVTSIGDEAFYGCDKLVEVINKSSLSISKGSSSYGYVAYYALDVHPGESKIVNYNDYLFYTFEGLNYLLGYVGTATALTLPNNYKGENYKIYNYAFRDCYGLTSVTIPDSVTSIGDRAFSDCSGLKSVTIPDSVTSIGEEAFDWCGNIKTVTVGQYICSNGLDIFSLHQSITNVVILDGVTNIGDEAFFYCSGLTSVTIPNSVTSIGNVAFGCCSGLTSITIPDSVTSIGDGAFFYCDGLTSVTIPDSVTSIGDEAFGCCYLLKSAILLGDAPGNVGNGIFSNCPDDFVIKVKKGTKGWNGDPNSTELPETWYGYPIEYATEDDLYPVLDANATAGDVANALSGSVDENLAKNITSVETYNNYREWALSVKNASGDEVAGVEAVKASTTAWISFALDQSKLIANEPVEGDVAIASLDAVAADGSFEFTVNINQIDVGDGAVEENLKKLFKIEGATSLGNDANFSSENVEIELAEPVNGDVKFKILPKDSPDSFFIRAKLLK